MGRAMVIGLVLALVAASATIQAQTITRQAALRDLDSLQQVLESRSSYLKVNGYDYGRHLDSLRDHLPDPVSVSDFAWDVTVLIGRLQDSHSDVEVPVEPELPVDPELELPFGLALHENRPVPISLYGTGPLQPGYPYLKSINGVPIERLLEIAGARHRGHSPQRFYTRATNNLEHLPEYLWRAGALNGTSLEVVLTDGERDTALEMKMGRQGPYNRELPMSTQVWGGRFAYLRIESMWTDNEPGDELYFEMMRVAMESQEFRESEAMIIDVRDNGGGSRDVLHYLLPFFIDGPLVYNAAYARHDTAGLAGRNLMLPGDPRRSPEARRAAQEFARTFRPLWEPPEGEFLEGLYVAVAEDTPTPYEYRDRSVIVLMDAWSFSATDIFLGAMKEVPNVTLIGTPSAGGSGRSRSFELPESGIEVTLSTMVSFTADGQLYDGFGIEPDILVEYSLQGVWEGFDQTLSAAVRHLLGR